MAPRKRVVNGTISKGTAIRTTGGTTLPPINDHPHTSKHTGSSPQEKVASSQPAQRQDQLLHMVTNMKEQMKEKQAQLDRDREQRLDYSLKLHISYHIFTFI